MRRIARTHRGQVSVIFALGMIGLIGVLSLSIDAGYVMAERRQAQSAADSAALAAAKALFDEQTGSIQQSARDYAALNSGALAADTQVDWPPASGNYAGNDKYVQVTLSKDVRKFFVGAVYGGDWRVSATATAGIEKVPANYALIALNEDSAPGIHLNGNTGIDISGDEGSAMSNTNITSTGSASFTADGSIDAHGSIQTAGGTWSTDLGPNTPVVEDPLEGTPPPPKGTSRSYPSNYCNNDCTLEEGYYRNGSLTIGRKATLQPGVYYFDNFDLVLQNTNSLLFGEDVLLYMTGSTIVFDSKNGNVHLTASPTAPYSGGPANLLFWYSRCTTIDMQGNGNLYFEGIFYAPCADVILHGNPNSDTINGQIFVGTLRVVGTSDVGVTYRNLVDTDRPHVFLVE